MTRGSNVLLVGDNVTKGYLVSLGWVLEKEIVPEPNPETVSEGDIKRRPGRPKKTPEGGGE